MSDSTDPQLYFAEDGNPRSARFDDIYYSLQDGLKETQAVFFAGCQLPDIWAGRRHFTVAELGFGTGLNICALIALWVKYRPEGGHLHIFSVEGYLMPQADAAQALGAWPELAAYAEALLAQWPPQRRGAHVMRFTDWGVTLTVALNDVRTALNNWQGRADAWFLDGFSPALNPDMWAEDVLKAVAAKSNPGARLATFTVAGFVRRGLTEAGFTPQKKPGWGKKRERLEAVLEGEIASRCEPQRIAVVGAGIAGASVIHALRHYGYEADLFDPNGLGGGASGNPAGLLTPRLDAGDEVIAGLYADAFYYATDLIRRLCPEAILSSGVLHRADTARETARFEKVSTQAIFDAQDMIAQPDGLSMRSALAIEPLTVLKALLGDVVPISKPLTDLGGYDRVFLTAGDGLFDMPTIADRFDLRPVRGQIEQVTSAHRASQAQAGLSYYVPTREGFVFGATHVRGDRGVDSRTAEVAQNIETLGATLPHEAAMARTGTVSRASVRVTVRDNLPLMGALGDGVYLLTGLGGRGFCLGPLLGHALVAEALGLASPLSEACAHKLRCERRSSLKIARIDSPHGGGLDHGER